MAVGNSIGCWIRKSGQIAPSAQIRLLAKFCHGLPRNFVYKKMLLTDSAFYWLLIRPVLTYCLVTMDFWSQTSGLIRLWTDWVYRCLVRFLGHKMCKTCWGLDTSFVGNMLSFLTPTRTCIFDNRSNAYNHLSTAHVRSLVSYWKSD
jgi:hypothetical protein